MKNMNEKLEKVYNFMVEYIDENGFSPSVRETCAALGIKSTATVYTYIEKLREKGYLSKSPLKKRTVVPTLKTEFKSVPVIGTVRAGTPILAVENLEGYIPLPSDFEANDSFALKISGDSMINAGIYDKDVIIVKECNTAEDGEIIVALIEDAATVKRFYKKNGKIVLHPENDQMEDMIFDDIIILGKVKGLIRKF